MLTRWKVAQLFLCACFAEAQSCTAWAQANQAPSRVVRTPSSFPTSPAAALSSLNSRINANILQRISLSMPLATTLTNGSGLAQRPVALQASVEYVAQALPISLDSAKPGMQIRPAQTAALAASAQNPAQASFLIMGKAVQSPSLDSVRSLAANMNLAGGTYRYLSAAQNSRSYFDGNLRAASDAQEGGGGTAADATPPPAESGQISAFHSRVIFLLDVFDKPASDKTVEFLQKIIDAGVHVVFMTWRPQKGPGSAEEILLSRIKYGRTNPIIVVSHNGGTISLHSKAKVPDFLLEPVKGFTPEDITAFRAINEKLQGELKLTSLQESGFPSLDDVFSYTVTLSRAVPAAEAPAVRTNLLRRYNELLRGRKLPFRMAPHPDNPRAIITHSMPLRISLRRVFASLDKVFHGEKILDGIGKFLILTDSKKSPKFTSSFPKGAEIQVVKTGEDVENTLGAVLRERSLHTVNIKLGKLRQYVEYWEPYHSHRSADGEFSGGGGGAAPLGAQEREHHQKLAMYTGSVIYQFMGWFFKKVQRGQHQFTANLGYLLDHIGRMWNNPGDPKYRINVNKSMAELMKSDVWKVMGPGYLEYAKDWFSNFYMREVAGDYSAFAKHVQHHLVSLGTGRKNLITLYFASPSTGRLYKIHTRIPRVMWHQGANGRVLTAYAYRTGDETPDDGEELYAKTMAMALLVGHGRRGTYQDADGVLHVTDNKWHHGSRFGSVIAELGVQFDYLSSARNWTFKPEELLKIEQNGTLSLGPMFANMDRKTLAETLHKLLAMTSPLPADPSAQNDVINAFLQKIVGLTHGPVVSQLISKMETMDADDEFNAYYEKEEERASAKDLPKSRESQAKTAAAARRTRRAASPRRTTKPK